VIFIPHQADLAALRQLTFVDLATSRRSVGMETSRNGGGLKAPIGAAVANEGLWLAWSRRRALLCSMSNPPDPSMSLLTALASAAATAYALAYVAHSEWGISRVKIREDALVLAALLGVAMTVKIVLQRKKGS
jgi:hypothetical protein